MVGLMGQCPTALASYPVECGIVVCAFTCIAIFNIAIFNIAILPNCWVRCCCRVTHTPKQGQPLDAISFMSLYIIAGNVHMD